jgi:hypothetical protein
VQSEGALIGERFGRFAVVAAFSALFALLIRSNSPLTLCGALDNTATVRTKFMSKIWHYNSILMLKPRIVQETHQFRLVSLDVLVISPQSSVYT